MSGRFAIIDSDGQSIEIKSLKSRALLVLLASQQGSKISKAWILDLLWNGPNHTEAKASLRQELSKLRRELRKHGVIVASERHDLSLDPTTISIAKPPLTKNFLTDFPPVSPNFDNWIAAQRIGVVSTGIDKGPSPALRPKTARWSVVIDCSGTDDKSVWFAKLFGDAVAVNVAETLTIPTSIGDGTLGQAGPHTLRVRIGMQSLDDHAGPQIGLRAELSKTDTDQQLWVGHQTVASSGIPPIEDPKVEGLIAQVVAALRHFLYRQRHEDMLSLPDRQYEQAMRDMFSMDASRVKNADTLLSQAYANHPRGLYLATRAQVRAIQRVERFVPDETALMEEAEDFIAHALEDEPNNSMVLALASNTVGHLMRSPDRSLEFAGRSAKINPSNPMAWWSLSSANMYVGNIGSSLRYAGHGLQLAQNLQFRYWWKQQAFGAVFLMGRHKEALKLLKSVNAENPAYRPPLRYMLSLYSHFGMDKEFAQTLDALRRLEPDFDVRRFHEDRDYPASLIHKSPGLNLGTLRDRFD
jgi:tetratricopeptide (TPR) repeat protein